MRNIIESTDNKKFKLFKGYLNKKNRLKDRIFLVEGLKVINESFDYINPISIAISERVYESEEVADILNNINENTDIYIFSDKIFKSLTDTEHSQGIIAYYKFLHFETLENLQDGKYVYLDDIKDPGNLGGIIRSAEAFNIKGVILSRETVDLYNPKVIRSTMASIFRIPVYIVEKSEILKLKPKFRIVSSAFENSVDSNKFSYDGNIILVIGNEAHGVCNDILGASDDIVKIPMTDSINSLNANVAASILMYEMYCSER